MGRGLAAWRGLVAVGSGSHRNSSGPIHSPPRGPSPQFCSLQGYARSTVSDTKCYSQWGHRGEEGGRGERGFVVDHRSAGPAASPASRRLAMVVGVVARRRRPSGRISRGGRRGRLCLMEERVGGRSRHVVELIASTARRGAVGLEWQCLPPPPWHRPRCGGGREREEGGIHYI